VVDPLDLDFISVSFPLLVVNSRIAEAMSLLNANIDALYLMGTWTGRIRAAGLRTQGDVFLSNGFHAEGEVNLSGATVGRDLDCHNGTFSNYFFEGDAPNAVGIALNADGIKVAGSIFLR
jgi:hypothetical protein